MEVEAEAAAPPVVASARRRWLILGICASALFLVGLDTTIVTVALPAIGDDLGVGADRLAWVVDAYTVVFAALLITAGALADRFGRRRVVRIGLALFALASVGCALAPTPGWLVAARAVQGIGASMLSPVALAIVVTTMRDPRERATAIGVWGSVFGLSMAVGPVAGGALLSLSEWRAVFWAMVPVALLALVMVTVLVPEPRGRPRRLDPPGQILLILLLGGAVTLLIEGPRLGRGSPTTLAGALALSLLVLVLARVERRRPAPLIDPGLFRSGRFTGAVLAALAVFTAFSMTLLLSTGHLQGSLGWSALAAGAATLPMALGATACAPLSGVLVGRVGPRAPLLTAGAALTLGALLHLAAASASAPLLMLLGLLVTGIGVGFANAPITDTAVNSLPSDRAGVAGGVASTARQVGTAIGIAVAGGLLAAGAAPTGVAPRLSASGSAGWVVVALCGAVVLGVALGATGRRGLPTSRGAGRASTVSR